MSNNDEEKQTFTYTATKKNKIDDDDKAAMIAGAAAVFLLPVFFTLVFILTIPFNLFEAWVIYQLYGWFLIPAPINAPEFSFWHFFGLTLFLSTIKIFFMNHSKPSNAKFKKMLAGIFGTALTLGFILLLGWFVQGWM